MDLGHWIGGVARATRDFARRMATETRGNVAMIFGISVPVLILMTLGGVDIHRASTVRVNLQDALDAAALAAARSPYEDNVNIQRVGLTALRANLKNYPNITLREADTTFVLNSDDVVVANSKVDVKTLVANIFLPPYGKFMDDYIKVGAHSEVDRSSRNVEVAMVLDLTGSMAGDRIEALIDAAKDLVDIVVQDVQTPYYSKVALAPYSNGVNPGSYLTSVRGGVVGSTNISNAVINFTGPQRTITSATRARPVVITTSAAHGFANGDVVWITSSSGMSQINNKPYVVTNKTSTTFELYTMAGYRVDGRNYGSYNGSGRVQECLDSDCSITVTSTNHGLSNNQYVHITDVNGMTQINDQTFLVGNVTTNTYTIDPPTEGSQINPYSSGGRSWCAQAGCTWYAFENVNEDLTANRITSCVTERTGAQAWTEAAPSGSSSWVGRHYPDTGGSCLDDPIVPLTSNKTTLKNAINGFGTTGTTAGHIGIAWGWYMLSPNWNTLWPSRSAGAYNTAQTLKAIVIMTDGEFNTAYCNAVPDSTSGVTSTYRNNCSANNGDPFTQSERLCDAMKAQNIVIYTVGFQISSTGDAADVLRYCASGTSNFHMADDADDLSGAFAAIGRDITQLRISK